MPAQIVLPIEVPPVVANYIQIAATSAFADIPTNVSISITLSLRKRNLVRIRVTSEDGFDHVEAFQGDNRWEEIGAYMSELRMIFDRWLQQHASANELGQAMSPATRQVLIGQLEEWTQAARTCSETQKKTNNPEVKAVLGAIAHRSSENAKHLASILKKPQKCSPRSARR